MLLPHFFSPISSQSFITRLLLGFVVGFVLLFFDSTCSLPLSVRLFIPVFGHECVRVCLCAGSWVLFFFVWAVSVLAAGSHLPFLFRCNYTLTNCLISSPDVCSVHPHFTSPYVNLSFTTSISLHAPILLFSAFITAYVGVWKRPIYAVNSCRWW